ncbi:MAG: GNAT family N-acetyltransferase [Chloroflexota bacterium]
MREIRELTTLELEESITLSARAYPGLELTNRTNRTRYRERIIQADEDPNTRFLGLFEQGEMRGVMRWHDFKMNFFGRPTLAGGLGGVAVDLLHKKEKVAAEMVQAFLRNYKDAGSPLAALYPFRPDFYRRMGFGYGTPMQHYRFTPASLPQGPSKSDLVYLEPGDGQKMHDCYKRFYLRTHGIMARQTRFWDAALNDPGSQIIGVNTNGRLSGYVVISFEKGRHDNFMSNAMHIHELIYDTADDLSRLLTFLQSQADQIESITYNTQDDAFYHLLRDPRADAGAMLPFTIAHENSKRGLGIMYRVLNVPRLFEMLEHHNFGGVSCCVRIDLGDSFFRENEGSYLVDVRDGEARVLGDALPEVVLSLDVAEFSSLVISAASLRKLAAYGLATISDDAYLDRLDRMFSGPAPICLTSF